MLAEAGAGQHSQRSADHCHFVTEDIAKEVLSDHDVKAARGLDELHRGIVHIEMGQGDVGVLLRYLDHRLPPQHGVCQHVGFVHRGHMLTAELRGLEGHVTDALDLALLIHHGVDDFDVAIWQCGAAFGLAKIEAAREFPHAEYVKTALHQVRTDGRGSGERRVTDAGAEVGKQAKVFANGQQGGALWLFIGWQAFPFWATDGAEEDRIAGLTGTDRFRRQCLTHRINGGTTDELVVVIKGHVALSGDGIEDFDCLGHDFRTDAIAGEDCKIVGAAHLGDFNGRDSGSGQEACHRGLIDLVYETKIWENDRTVGNSKIVSTCLLLLWPSAQAAEKPSTPQEWEALLQTTATIVPAESPPLGSFAPAAKRIRPSVVTVVALAREVEPEPLKEEPDTALDLAAEPKHSGKLDRQIVSVGSGVIVTQSGHIVTASHVLSGAETIMVRTRSGGRDLDCRVLGIDQVTDLALLRIEGPLPADLKAATLGDSDLLEPADFVMAVGSPYGLDQSVSLGIVSGTGRFSNDPAGSRTGYCIQTDAATHPGNSGGPLIDSRGVVVGINVARYGAGFDGSGLGLALPINLVRTVMADLAVGGSVPRGYSGVEFGGLSAEETLRRLGRSAPTPASVQLVSAGSPAERAGFSTGDVVLGVNGISLPSRNAAVFALRSGKVGDILQVSVLRGADQVNLSLTLTEIPPEPLIPLGPPPQERAAGPDGQPVEPASTYAWPGGLKLARIDPRTRLRLGIPDTIQGVLITEAPQAKEEIAKKLLPDVVIVGVNGNATADLNAARTALLTAPRQSPIILRVWRDGKSSYLAVPRESLSTPKPTH